MPRIAKRKRLEGVPREQWDPMHPGPLAFAIRPTHVDSDLVRFEIFEQTEKEIKAWIRLPSAEQLRVGCDGCNHKHLEKNKDCSANKRGKKIKRGRYGLMDRFTGEFLEGRWVVTSWEIKPGYTSGRAVLNKK